MHRGYFALPAVVFFIAAARPAAGQDTLDSIIKSPTITARQRATMAAEVALRARRMINAKGASSREDGRDRLTRTAQTPGASQAGLDTYAEICAEELSSAVGGESLEPAIDSILVLSALSNANTASALANGLQSSHPAVRLMAARSVERLHDKLKDDQVRCRNVLRDLGRAGAKEQDENVLRVIYQAIDVKANVRDFKYGSESADALLTIFESRLGQLEAGARDEMKEEYGIEAAARCYPDATNAQKARLISAMSRLLAVGLDRYFDPETATEYLGTLSRFLGRVDDVIRQMARSSGVTLSCEALKLSARASDTRKQKEDAEKVLQCINQALSGDPWRIR